MAISGLQTNLATTSSLPHRDLVAWVCGSPIPISPLHLAYPLHESLNSSFERLDVTLHHTSVVFQTLLHALDRGTELGQRTPSRFLLLLQTVQGPLQLRSGRMQ